MANSKSDSVTLRQIEATLNDLLATAPGGLLTRAAVLKALNAGQSQELKTRIERAVESDGRFFTQPSGEYQLRDVFFHNYEFLITPDAWEIENGVLFPGHRFLAYVAPEVFPSEVKLLPGEQSQEPVAMTTLTAPLSQIFHYHLLLGSEQVFDFLVADSPANARLKEGAAATEPVTLNVFDLKALYQATDFAPGDALLCRVEDSAAGIIRFRVLPGDQRKNSDVKSAVAALEQALKLVIERFENYLEIPEQLSWALYLGKAELSVPCLASFDELIRETNQLEINFDQEHTVLALRNTAAEDHYEPELPEGVTVSRGETGELSVLLREIGSPLTPAEVDGFILDNCYARELDFEEFFARAFGREKLNFADEAQQAVFYNYIEDRFEEQTTNYNRVDDEPKAPLRATIMEVVEERLAFFDFLGSLEHKLDTLPQADVHALAEISLQLNEILKLLNSPGYTPDEAELARLEETIEQRADDQEMVIARLTDHLEDGDCHRENN